MIDTLILYLILFIFLILACSYLINHDILFPSNMMIISFLIFSIYTFLLMNKIHDSLTFETFILIILFLFLFSMASNGSYFVINMFTPYKRTGKNVNKSVPFIEVSNNRLIVIIIIQFLILCIIALYLKKTLGSINSQTLSEFREATEYHSKDFNYTIPSWYHYLEQFSQYSSFFSMFILINNHFSNVRRYQNKYFLLLSSLLFVPLSILSSSRYIIFIFVLYALFIYIYISKYLHKRLMKSFLSVLILFCVSLPLFKTLGKFIGRSNNNSPIFYLGGSIASFNDYIRYPANYISNLTLRNSKLFGVDTFNNVYKGLYKLHIIGRYPASDISQQFAGINGYPIGNVYTALRPFYEDFGIPGIIVFALLLGIVFGYLYHKIKSIKLKGRVPLLLIIYSFMNGMLILSPYSESICSTFVSLGFLIDVFILIFLKYYYRV